MGLVVVDEQARELAGNGTVCCCCYSGCRTRQLIVTCRVGELAYLPQLPSLADDSPQSRAPATWRLLDLDWAALYVCLAGWLGGRLELLICLTV